MYRLLRFPDFKDKAVTLSYDDGSKHDARLIEIMQKHGLKGTFNISSSHLQNEPENSVPIATYLDAGMEIAMHGENHLWVVACTGADEVGEFYRDKQTLEKLTGRMMRGGAYAYGTFTDRTVGLLRSLGVSYFRTCHQTYDFALPGEWLRWPMTCTHGYPKLFELVDAFLAERPKGAVYYEKPRLFYLMGHSWEFARDNSWDVIEQFGERVGGREDVWYATNAEIYDYVHAFEGLLFTAAGDRVFNPSATDVYLWVDGKNVLARAGRTTAIEA